jgi:murein endopeptidase
MVTEDPLDVYPKIWTHADTEVVRVAAEDPVVSRIFVNAAIKKAMCRDDNVVLGAVVRYYEHAPTHAWVLMPSAAVKFLFRIVACDGYDPVVSPLRRL